MEPVIEWLKGKRNFIVGRALYKKFGTDEQLKAILSAGVSVANEALLARAMEALLHTAEEMQTDENVSLPLADNTVSTAIKAEWMPKYQRMNKLRHDLHRYGNSNSPEAIAAREQLVFRILDDEQDIMQGWDKEAYYKKNGHLPFVQEAEVAIPTNPVQLAVFIGNVKRNVRRNRQLMNSTQGKPVYTQKYEHYKALYKQITGEEYQEVGNG